MKKVYFFWAVVSLGISSSYAQQVDNYKQDTTTVYARPKGFSNDPVRSRWRQELSTKDGLWVLKLYDKKDNLQEQVCFVDKQLLERSGPYHRYENGVVIEEGRYEKGYKVGEWKSYYVDKKLKEVANYKWDKLDGKYVSYWHDGAIKKDGRYIVDKRIGAWQLFYENGKPLANLIYDENGKRIEGSYFDEEGKSTARPALVELPHYFSGKEGFDRFVAKNVKPQYDQNKQKLVGVVVLEVTVETDGKLDYISVSESPSEQLSREAIRLLKVSEKWIAAKELGDNIKMRIKVPLKIT